LIEEIFDPLSYIVHSSEPVRVKRQGNDLIIQWTGSESPTAIYAGPDPDHIDRDRPIGEMDDSSGQALIRNSERTTRLYFEVHFPDGRRRITTERTLWLPGGVNFRDIGGYRTYDGRITRWGQVYRAGSMAALNDDEVAYLDRLGLRLSYDLRTLEEAERQPDRLPAAATLLHRPIVGNVSRLRRIVTLYRKRHHIQEVLEAVYIVMLDQNSQIFADIFHTAADPANLPLVIHCTAGKDRTGLATALLLSALGVPEETVVADYTLSNHAFDVLAGRMQPEMRRLYSFGFGEVQLRPFLLAEARTMEAALTYIRQRYGSLDWYLQKAGVTDETLERVRDNLLTSDE
jgi:protein-tyrosine phosphatase